MKKQINNKHLLFYLGAGAILVAIWTLNNSLNHAETFWPRFLNQVWRGLYLIVVNFIFFEYCVPFIKKKRSWLIYNILNGIILSGLLLLAVSLALYGWVEAGIALQIYTSYRAVILIGGRYAEIIEQAFYHGEAGLSSVVFFGIGKLFYDNFKLKQTAQQLRLERQEAELNYLKSQTNPHFLFNTLNNIYTLAREKSDLVPETVLRLSKILRFMLYEANGQFITIAQELEIIDDYVALESLRYNNTLQLNFKKDIEDPNQLLPPLLMIPLVENAFKHGVSESRGKRFIDVYLSVKNEQLEFVVKNSSDTTAAPIKENIGLSNMRRQLQLLYTDHSLTIQNADAVFTVTLKINLLSHA